MLHRYQTINWMSSTLAAALSFAYYLSLSSLLHTITSFQIDDPINGGVLALVIAVSFYPTQEILSIILSRALGLSSNYISRERIYLARDLHDTVLQDLHRAQINLARLPNQKITEMVALDLQKAISQTRAICLNLSSHKSPLSETICHLVENTLPDLNTTCIINPQTVQLGQKVEKQIYYIIQEAVSNIAKHAQAERAEIRLDVFPNRIHLFIQDDGIGFDPLTVKKEQLGLSNIRSRVAELGGTYELETAPTEGTAHWVYIPR